MAFREVTMLEVKEVILLWKEGEGISSTAAQGRESTARPFATTSRPPAKSAGPVAGPGASHRRAVGCGAGGAQRVARAAARRRLGTVRRAASVHRRQAARRRQAVQGAAAAAPRRRRRAVRDAAPVRRRGAGLWPHGGDDPRRRRRAGPGGAARHRLGGCCSSPTLQPSAVAFRAWIFTAVRSRHRFVYPCFAETTAERHRGVRGGVGVLRRRLPRRSSPTTPRRSSQTADPLAAAHQRGVSRVRAGARLPHRPGARRAARRTKRASSAACRRCATTASAASACYDARASARARPALVPRRVRHAPSLAHAAPAARALRGRGEAGAPARADEPLRRAAVVRAQGRARPARAGRQGALLAADAVRRQEAARPRRPRPGALLRRARAGQDAPAQATGRPLDGPARLPAPRSGATRCATSPSCSSRPTQHGDARRPLRARAARRAAALDAHAPRLRAARAWPSATATSGVDETCARRARGRHARRPSGSSACSNAAVPPAAAAAGAAT